MKKSMNGYIDYYWISNNLNYTLYIKCWLVQYKLGMLNYNKGITQIQDRFLVSTLLLFKNLVEVIIHKEALVMYKLSY